VSGGTHRNKAFKDLPADFWLDELPPDQAAAFRQIHATQQRLVQHFGGWLRMVQAFDRGHITGADYFALKYGAQAG